MKRLLITLLTILTAIGTTTAASPKRQKLAPEAPHRLYWAEGHASYYRQYPLYGDVESITIHYKRTYGDKVKVDEKTFITFNERGDVISDVCINEMGDTTHLMKIEYDSRGDVCRRMIWDNGKLRMREEFLYSNDRKTQIWQEYNADGELVFEKVLDYNPRAREMIFAESDIEKHEHEVEAGGIKCKTTYEPPYWLCGSCTDISTYNDIGKVAHQHRIYKDVIEHYTYKYDKRGLEIEEIKWSNKIEYSVTDSIDKLEGIELSKIGVAEHYKIERDKRGNVVKITAEPDYSGYKSVTTYDIEYRK